MVENSSADSTTAFLSEDQLREYDEMGFIVLPDLLNEDDLSGVKQAMNHKVDLMAKTWFAQGLVPSLYEDEPFESRLAKIASHLTEKQYLSHG